MADENRDRWTDIRGIHKKYLTFYQVGGGFTIIALLLLFGGIIFANGILNDYTTNVFTEAVSAVASVIVTVLILDKRAEQREEKRRIRELQEHLVREAGSPDNATALNAVRELDAYGWLRGEGGLLQRMNLLKANLQGVTLLGINLQGANLLGANLQGANLLGTNLQGADLRLVDLDQTSILPDGTLWTPDTDMARFTDPHHPDFWRSDDPGSPTYRSDAPDNS